MSEDGKRSRLGPKKPSVDPAALDSFAAGSLTVPPPGAASSPDSSPPPAPEKIHEEPSPAPAAVYPWEEPHVRADLKKQILLRVPEPLYLQLMWVAKISRSEYTSMNQIILDGTEKLVKAELKKLGIQL